MNVLLLSQLVIHSPLARYVDHNIDYVQYVCADVNYFHSFQGVPLHEIEFLPLFLQKSIHKNIP